MTIQNLKNKLLVQEVHVKFNNFEIAFFPISGMMLGIEFFNDEEDDTFYTILDLVILRIMFIKG